MRFLLLLLAFITVLTPHAHAQDVLREHRAEDPAAKLLDKHGGAPSTVNEYANLYFNNCVASAQSKDFEEYNVTQCGCTSAKMPEFMTLKNMKALFTKTKEGEFQMGRVLMLAYMPCMYDTIYQFVFDGCFYSEETRKGFTHPTKVCKCYGKRMADYVASKGERFIPGLTDKGYVSAEAVPDPLGYIIGGNQFNTWSRYQLQECVMTESYGWGK